MGTFAIIQSIISLITLFFLAYQGYGMKQTIKSQRNQLKVNSYFQIWTNHIANNHSSVYAANDENAKIFNKYTPYHSMKIVEAKEAHFADAIFDLYESIFIMEKSGILEKEVSRAWKESIPYELKNENLRKHWLKYHSPKYSIKENSVYVNDFANYVDIIISKYMSVDNKE